MQHIYGKKEKGSFLERKDYKIKDKTTAVAQMREPRTFGK